MAIKKTPELASISILKQENATDLIEYYHKEVGGKQYFLKYHPASNQGTVIVIDSYSKVIVEAECRTLVNVIQQELQSFEKQIVYDE